MNLSLTHKEIIIDKDKVFRDPASEAREWLEQYIEEKENGGGTVSQKACPECSKSVEPLEVECLHCGADLRTRCEFCGLPLSGEQPLCQCGGFASEEERQEHFRTSPRSKRANRPGGGRGLRWLAGRRKRYGY